MRATKHPTENPMKTSEHTRAKWRQAYRIKRGKALLQAKSRKTMVSKFVSYLMRSA